MGMPNTQRSKGINMFLKGYMNLNSDLKQFTHLFEMCLVRKVEQEKIMNANIMKGPLSNATKQSLLRISKGI